MPDLVQDWTTPSQLYGIQGVTITPKGSQGISSLKPGFKQPLSPSARPTKPQILVMPGSAALHPWWIRMASGRCV